MFLLRAQQPQVHTWKKKSNFIIYTDASEGIHNKYFKNLATAHINDAGVLIIV